MTLSPLERPAKNDTLSGTRDRKEMLLFRRHRFRFIQHIIVSTNHVPVMNHNKIILRRKA